jgi:putative PIN family toxin of toxin-antitoxin system
MRLVVDTNVFVSAALKASSWPAYTLRWVSRHGTLLKTAATEQEILDVLRRPRIASKLAPFVFDQMCELLAAAKLVAITERIAACRDPDDDKFIELAVSGRADALISGDEDLLSLGSFRRIPIIPPAAFGQSKLL